PAAPRPAAPPSGPRTPRRRPFRHPRASDPPATPLRTPRARTPPRSGAATAAQTRAYVARAAALAPQLRAEIAVMPARPHGRPALVVLMGLPGAGKSHCARLLCARLGAAHVASDELRSRLFIAASYADEENRAVFAVAAAVVDSLLADGHRVVLDATNLLAANRAAAVAAAGRRGAQGGEERLNGGGVEHRGQIRYRRHGD